jgi:hypothetical protein
MHAYSVLTDPSARPVALILGAVLLLAGRKLFWLLVGVVGFLAAYSLSFQYFHLRPAGTQLVVAVVVGLVGVLLAIFLQRVAIALAGFLLGAYLAAELLGVALAPSAGRALAAIGHLSAGQELVVLVVGVLAALIAVRLFDVALIVLSALAGAGLVSNALLAGASLRLVLLVVLAVVGIAVQAGWSRRTRAPARASRA